MSADALSGLNPSQREACEHLDGPVLILAGAGSGKTRTVTARVARILQLGLAQPREILAVTFTNKAAGEMKDRISAAAGPDGRRVWAMTFHRLSAQILRASGEQAGAVPGAFTIADAAASRQLLKEAFKAAFPGHDDPAEVKKARAAISRSKNQRLSPRDLPAQDARIAAAWTAYGRLLSEAGMIDFDDMLVLAERTLASPAGREAWAGRFKYVHVDEYQDTNPLQERILRHLAPHGRVCAVGDDLQSVYRFRGAEVGQILNFERDWPGTKVIKLEENYRSSQAIVQAANALASAAAQRTDKQLVATRPRGVPVRLLCHPTHWDEAAWVASDIEARISRGAPPSSIAVVYRNNAQSQEIEEELKGRGVPYHVVGGLEFLARAEVRDALAYLQLLANPADRLAFERAVGAPRRGCGPAAIAKVLQAAAGGSLIDAAAACPAPAGMAAFGALMLRASAANPVLPLHELLAGLLKGSGLLASFAGKGPEGQERLMNCQALVNRTRAAEGTPWRQALPLFLEQAALAEADPREKPSGVSLMTMHATKGLEFPTVYLTGLEQRLLLWSAKSGADVEESRRLLYVGMTRAMEELIMSHCEERMAWGERQSAEPAAFLADLPGAVVREQPGPTRRRRAFPDRGKPAAGASRGQRPAGRPAPSRRDARQPLPRPRPAKAARSARKRIDTLAARDSAGVAREFATGMSVVHPRHGAGRVFACYEDGGLRVAFSGARIEDVAPGHLRPAGSAA